MLVEVAIDASAEAAEGMPTGVVDGVVIAMMTGAVLAAVAVGSPAEACSAWSTRLSSADTCAATPGSGLGPRPPWSTSTISRAAAV